MKQTFSEPMHRIFSVQNLVYAVAIVLFFFLGSGISRYLGQNLEWGFQFLGLGYVLLLFLSGLFIQAYFDPMSIGLKSTKNPKGGPETEKSQKYLSAGLTSLTVCCVLLFLILNRSGISSSAILFLVLSFVLIFFYAVPPFRLGARGYGELIMTLWIVDLIPAQAYLLNGNPIHQLILFLAFPLTTLFLAMMISTSLQRYFAEMISGQKSLLIMLGWKLGMNLHNGLVLVSYLIIGIASLIGLPWNLAWPMLLPAPIFLFSVYEILRIKSGTKPRWSLLSLSGYAGMGCTLYMLLFTLWIR